MLDPCSIIAFTKFIGFLLDQGPGLFEPIHGSAPDIAGQVGFFYFCSLIFFR